uniref:Uncharacterized protein n=1 Tax=Cannabis sativa TaxID=3483 RepID=A0A803QYR9_CANSA
MVHGFNLYVCLYKSTVSTCTPFGIDLDLCLSKSIASICRHFIFFINNRIIPRKISQTMLKQSPTLLLIWIRK